MPCPRTRVDQDSNFLSIQYHPFQWEVLGYQSILDKAFFRQEQILTAILQIGEVEIDVAFSKADASRIEEENA